MENKQLCEDALILILISAPEVSNEKIEEYLLKKGACIVKYNNRAVITYKNYYCVLHGTHRVLYIDNNMVIDEEII